MAVNFGGAERTTSNLLRYLDRGKVQHITLMAPEILRPHLPPNYDRFIDASRYGLHGWFENARSFYTDASRVASILREVVPDIALGMMHYSAGLVVLGAHLSGLSMKTVASFRGPAYEYLRRYEHGLRRLFFLRTAIAGTALLADRILVPSQGTKQELQRRFWARKDRIVVIPNGIDGKAVARAAQESAPGLDEFGRGQSLLCTAARLVPEKNLHLLFEAVRRVRRVRRVRPVVLLVVGDGPERRSLEESTAAEGLSEAVIFVGHQENVFPFLRRADLFIHTCQFEGFGYAVLEALACGTPVIATDCPYGPREIIGDDQYGILVPPDSVEALAEAILNLLDDSSARRRLATRGLQRAGELSIDRMVRHYESVLTGLVSGDYPSRDPHENNR